MVSVRPARARNAGEIAVAGADIQHAGAIRDERGDAGERLCGIAQDVVDDVVIHHIIGFGALEEAACHYAFCSPNLRAPAPKYAAPGAPGKGVSPSGLIARGAAG